MTTPTNSDRLRERLEEVVGGLDPRASRQSLLGVIWLVIEAEIDKLNAEKAETIEVLGMYSEVDNSPHPYYRRGQWWFNQAKPLLDKLKGTS